MARKKSARGEDLPGRKMKPVGPLRLIALAAVLAAGAWYAGLYAQEQVNVLSADLLGLGDLRPRRSAPAKPPEVNFN